MVEKKLFDRAANFSDAAIAFIDDDDYPFSAPVSFQIDSTRQMIRLSRPAGAPALVGRSVGVIFNYVTPIPGGGYTDRRYVEFWGRLEADGDHFLLKPTKGFTWDEKEVPFFQYSEMGVPRGRKYLDALRQKPWLSFPWLLLRTFRLPFVVATILPVALGAAVAYRVGFFDWGLFALTMIGALMIHLGVNTANDFFDSRSGADDVNTTPTPYSGGSRVIQYGLVPPPTVLSISTLAYLAGCMIGVYLALVRGWPILAIGLVGFLVSYEYTAPPLKLAYHGLGELAVAVGFGPLLVLGSYFVQTQSLSLEAFLASLPVGLLVMLILYVNELPDRTWDEEAGKRTLVARMRDGMALNGFWISVIAVYGVVVSGAAMRIFPVTVLLGLLTVPLAFRVGRAIKGNLGNPYGLMPAMSDNIKLYICTAALILLGYVIFPLLM